MIPRATSTAQSVRTPLAFTHVTVIDTAHAVAQDDQTVLLAGDRIADVGKTGTVTVPVAALVVYPSKYLPADVRARWQQELPRRQTSPQQEVQRQKNQQQRLTLVTMMSKAGVPMMAGTDVGNPFIFPGFSVHDELTTFVRAGLTPGEALTTATYNPARFLGMLDRQGTVEKGKLADLVLLDANPLKEIHYTQKIQAVVLNGRSFDRQALDKLLADAAARAATR